MILVTGGTGIVGCAVVRELKGRGESVRILAREKSQAMARRMVTDVTVGDLGEPQSLRRAMEGVGGVVHAACTFHDHDVDVSAMEVLLDAWDEGPFLFISSVDVYGLVDEVPVTEEHALNGHWPYAQGKIRNEQLLIEAARAQGRSDWSILRPPNIWGPNPRCLTQRESLAFPLVELARADATVKLPGASLEECRQFGDDWIDARELAWAVAECLEHPLGEAANVINGHFRWYDFATELVRLVGSASRVEHGAASEGTYAQHWQYSGERLRRRLGFKPWCRWQDTWAEIVALEQAAD